MHGIFLDLIFTSFATQTSELVQPHGLFDSNSVYHTITMHFINRGNSDIQPNTKVYDFNSTKLNHTKFALLNVQPQLITNADCEYYYKIDESKFVLKITQFTDAIKYVQNKFTKFKKSRKKTKAHPWTANRHYQRLLKRLKAIKKKHIANPTLQTKSDLRIAHIEAYKCYNVQKEKHPN